MHKILPPIFKELLDSQEFWKGLQASLVEHKNLNLQFVSSRGQVQLIMRWPCIKIWRENFGVSPCFSETGLLQKKLREDLLKNMMRPENTAAANNSFSITLDTICSGRPRQLKVYIEMLMGQSHVFVIRTKEI